MLDGTMPPLALDKDGALQPRQQAEERPVIDLLLGDEAGRQRGREDDDVEPRDMVADEQRRRRGRRLTDLAHLDPQQPGEAAMIEMRQGPAQRADRKSVVEGSSV